MNFYYTDEHGREFEIDFTMYGEYRKATFYDPPEEPQIDSIDVWYKGKDFEPIEKRLRNKKSKWIDDFYKTIESEIWKKLEGGTI